MFCNRFLLCLCLFLFFGLGLVGGTSVPVWAETAVYRVVEGDTIRGILLRTACATSMTAYADLREAFRHLNPQLVHSGMLVAGQDIVILREKQRPACLQSTLGQVVRVEFESQVTSEKVRIYMDGPVLPDVFLLKNQSPHRLVCDFDEILPGDGLEREFIAPGRLVRALRIGHEDTPFQRARLVFDLEESLVGQVEQFFYDQESMFELTLHERF